MATSNSNEPKAPATSGNGVNSVPVTKDEVQKAHEQRVKGAFPGIDARLDNRVGDQRPAEVTSWPAKPQQVDGPDVMHQAEFTKRALAEREKAAEGRKGMFSAGPHGVSDDSLRESGPKGVTDQVLYGTEGLDESEMKASTKDNTKEK